MRRDPLIPQASSPPKKIRHIALYVLLTLIVLLAWFVILNTLFFGSWESIFKTSANQSTAFPTIVSEPSPTSTEAPAVALLPSTTDTPTLDDMSTPTAEPASALYVTPTPEPGGRVLSVRPLSNGIGWWASDGARGSGADSFVYAGQFDGKTLISMIQFDLQPIAPGTPIREITLRLTGLSADRLVPAAGGTWTIDLITPGIVQDPLRADFTTLYTAPTAQNLLTLDAADLDVGRKNDWTFGVVTRQWLAQQIARGYPTLLIRISASGSSGDTLFAWDSGLGSSSAGNAPELVISLGGEPSTPLPPVIVTPTPMPENVQTAAVMSVAATAEAERIGTPTPLPFHYVVATTTPTPFIVTSTPTPENAATAAAISLDATAIALTTGTFTPTPTNMVTATPTPMPTATPTTPLIESLAQMSPTPTPTSTPTPPSVLPPDLVGQILFWSNRNGGQTQLYALNPTTAELSLLTQDWPYTLAKSKETLSPDGRFTVIVQEDLARIPQIKIHDHEYDVIRQLTATSQWSYDPALSPQGERIAFVSQEPGNDEIYVIAPDGTNMQRLTTNSWEWDKHPSWSPDGSQIVFWSNRETGRRQLWVMNRDGSNQRRLLDSPGDDWDPVWVK